MSDLSPARMVTFACLAFATTLMVFAADANSTVSVRVIEPSGALVEGATVTCTEPQSQAVLSDRQGIANLIGPCARVSCTAPQRIGGESVPAGTSPIVCVVAPSASIMGELATRCRGACTAALLDAEGKPLERIVLSATATGTEGKTEFAFMPRRPGRFGLEVALADPATPDTTRWRCTTDLGVVPPGRHRVVVPWREPESIRGKVVDGRRAPMAGMTVAAWSGRPVPYARWQKKPVEHDRWTCAPATADAVKTGSDGTFRVVADPALETLVIAGTAEDARGFGAVVTKAPAEAVVLSPALPVRVTGTVVYAEDGTRAPGCTAALEPEDPDARWIAEALGVPLIVDCGRGGQFQVGPFRSVAFGLEVTPKPGLFARVHEAAPAAGRTVDLREIKVSRGAGIDVLVVDHAGTPIENATVEARGSAGVVLRVKSTTDREGHARLAGLPPRCRVLLSAEARGYRPAYLGEQALEASPFRITLEPGAIVAGHVRTPWGDPIVGAALSGPGRATTDDDGRYEFGEVGPGKAKITASAAGFRSSRPLELDLHEGDRREDADFTLEAAPGLSGTVLTPDGRPAAGARVTVVPEWELSALDSAAAKATASVDSEGHFKLCFEPDSNDRLVARAPGFGPAVAQALLSKQGEELTLTLADPARLVANLPPGLSRDAHLTVVDGSGVGRTMPVAGRARVEVDELAPGDGQAFLAYGAKRPARLVAGQTVEVSLTPGGIIEGRVTAEGLPVSGAFVGLGMVGDDMARPGPGQTFTDTRGGFTIEGLAADNYLVFVQSPAGYAERKVTLPEDGHVTVDLAIERVALVVKVTDQDKKTPIDGADATLIPRDFTGKFRRSGFVAFPEGAPGFKNLVSNCACDSDSTGPAGDVLLVVPKDGPYRLTVAADGYTTWQNVVELKPGDNEIAVTIAHKSVRTLRITSASDAPKPYGYTLALNQGKVVCSGVGQETLTCSDIPEGTTEVLYRIDGWGLGRAVVDVPATGEVEVTVRAARGGELVVPVSGLDAPMPFVRGEDGLEWSALVVRTHSPWNEPLRTQEVPGLGPAWVFGDLPSGRYEVVVGGVPRALVDVPPGGRAIAR